MPQLIHDPRTDITPEFLRTVHGWIAEYGTILVISKRLYCMADIDYALISSERDFDRLVELCSDGTKVIAFRGRPVPIAGVVDDAFINLAVDALSSEDEYILIEQPPKHSDDHRCKGETDYTSSLRVSLEERMGETVTILACPHRWHIKSDKVTFAYKGGIDGPR